jgi:GT2 family glycosyltransferase
MAKTTPQSTGKASATAGSGNGLDDVSVVVPFHNRAAMTIACLKSIAALGLGEIVLVSNRSDEAQYCEVEAAAAAVTVARVVRFDEPFNYQRINNWALSQTTGVVVWLLNNDVVVPTAASSLVRHMAERARQDDVGAVGCVLVYSDGTTIQHAGVHLVPGGTATHLYAGRQLADVVRAARTDSIRQDRPMTAVTGASMMMEKRKYDAVGGLNEAFVIGGGDVDICLRLAAKGWHTVLVGTDYGVMVHHEAQSRAHLEIPYSDFVESYKSYIKAFDLDHGDLFVPASPPEGAHA